MTPCPICAGSRTISLPNPAWTPDTPREATATTGAHGRPLRPCPACVEGDTR
jgi:hypothetical protein